jgi:hypothetical protein
MLFLSSGVGSNATNHPHDVAAVQAALINLRPSPQRPAAATWRGRMDGRSSRDLEAAIAALQAATNQTTVGQQPTGRLDPGGPTVTWIGNNLTHDVGTVRGLPGTGLAFACKPSGAPSRQQRRDAAERRSPVPSDMGRGLGRLVETADGTLGLPVIPEAFAIDGQGRFTATLTCPGVRWFDETGKLQPAAGSAATTPPADALRMLHRIAAGVGELSEGGFGDAVVTSRTALACLRSPTPRLDPAQATRLGIAPTGDTCAGRHWRRSAPSPARR